MLVLQLLQLEAVSTKIGAGCVAAVEEVLQQAPSAHVALVGLLPRGDRNVEAPSVAYHQPSKCVPLRLKTDCWLPSILQV